MKIECNKHRISYLLSLYRMTEAELLSAINVDLKTPITWNDIYADEVEVNHLKRVDKVFKKGLIYYSDPSTPRKDKGISVFFRKETFATELNIGARKRVREFEDMKTKASAVCKLSKYIIKRTFPTYSLSDDPQAVAFAFRDNILPPFTSNKRDYLKNYINKLGESGILVFEFVDTSNKKEKANIDGFFIEPNAIIIKRIQDGLSREIFTLSHEVGHYLLQKEDVDEIDFSKIDENTHTASEVENWCNTFACNLLLGKENAASLDSIALFDHNNDYGHDLVQKIAGRTNLSRLAIFTNLFLQRKLTFGDYSNVRDELHQQWLDKKEKIVLRKEMEKANGIVPAGRNPKPIQSDLLSDIYNSALNRGVVSEREYCTALNVKPYEISKFFYEGGY